MKKLITIFALIGSFGIIGNAQIKSIYTSLDTKFCKTIEQTSEDAGWYRGECRGVGKYKLEVTEGDLRQSIGLIMPSKEVIPLNFNNVSSAFSSVAEKAEWRVKGTTPIALIVRFNASENPDDTSKTTSYLIVSKITAKEACIVDVIKPSKSQNVMARQSADNASTKPCKTFD